MKYVHFFRIKGICVLSSLWQSQRLIIVNRQIRAETRTNNMRKHDRIESGLEVFGKTSDVNVKNTARASKHVMAYPTRSPLSVGRMNTIPS